MRISFKYFLQLLSAINTCHKINIVHRDLKLQNILLSDTFQLKVADFGLASIVDNTKDKIYNVGTPMYKSPELLENDTIYDFSNVTVLKACDVFSLSIIFWQMMNGIEYLPFKCYKYNGINDGNYKLIKTKQFDKFWNVHEKCNMLSSSDGGDHRELSLLFEQMFEYNPHERITISEILTHQFILSNENDALFYMNDTTLEAFVRDRYHQTKNNKTKHTLAPQTYYTKNKDTSTNNKTSGIFPWLLEDSSQAQISPNASKIHADDNKIIYSYNPLVVMVGIQDNDNTSDRIARDYISGKQMLHDVKHFDIIYHNSKHEIAHLTRNGSNDNQNNNSTLFSTKSAFSKQGGKEKKTTVNEMIKKEFALSWTANELDKFNDQIFDI